jgi:CsoR family transcriptional regulator, copper-sensing transcriptional repressor
LPLTGEHLFLVRRQMWPSCALGIARPMCLLRCLTVSGDAILYTEPPLRGYGSEGAMLPDKKSEVLKRLAFIEGHLQGVRRMVEGDKCCVGPGCGREIPGSYVLKQTYAVRRAIEKIEGLMLDNQLYTCVIEGVRDGRDHQVIGRAARPLRTGQQVAEREIA